MFENWCPRILMSPEGDESYSNDVSADVDLLAADEEEVEKEVEEEEEVKEEVEEGKEVEEEVVEESDESKSGFLLSTRPTVTELKTAFPEIFKKFPVMKDVLFREQEFTKMFPTVDIAKAAAENSTALDNFKEALASGDATGFAAALVEINAVDKVAPNLLSSLYKVSPEAYTAAVTPAFEKAVKIMYQEGLDSKNDNIANAALVMSKWLFGDFDIAKGAKSLQRQEDPEVARIKSERETEINETYKRNHTEVSNTAVKQLESLITDKLDPENVLSNYLKGNITKDVLSEVTSQLASDGSYIKYMDGLWAEYKRKGYPGDLKDRIISSFLSRAKPLIPGIRARIMKEAKGVAIRNASNRKVRSIDSGTKQPAAGGTSRENGFDSSKKIDYNKTSDEDLLNGKITYRS